MGKVETKGNTINFGKTVSSLLKVLYAKLTKNCIWISSQQLSELQIKL